MVPLVYSPAYNITALDLERLHRFDSRKYARIRNWLIRQGLRKSKDFIPPQPVSNADLRQLHGEAYLRSLRDRRVLARILELPPVYFLPSWLTNWRVLKPMRWATGGTILACQLALEHGLAINLAGGYHHASLTVNCTIVRSPTKEVIYVLGIDARGSHSLASGLQSNCG